MAKKLVKGTGLRLTLEGLHKKEDIVLNHLDKIYDQILTVETAQNSIRTDIETARHGMLMRIDQKTLDVLERQNTTDVAVSAFEKNSLRAWDEIRSVLNRHKHESADAIQDLREILLKQVKDESLEIVKGYRALTHFSWEKLSETEDRIIQAQNAATKITMLVSVAQCIMTLAVVGAMLWFK